MKIRFIFSFIWLVITLTSYGQSTGLTVEVVATHTEGVLAGKTTYRLWAMFDSPNNWVWTVGGSNTLELPPLSISTTTSFWQSAFGGASVNNMNCAFFEVDPNAEFDSWISIGKECNSEPGSLFTLQSPDQPWISQFESGDNILMNDAVGGAWFSPASEPNTYVGNDLKILLGQFTTNGVLSGSVNLQVNVTGEPGSYIMQNNLTFSSNDVFQTCNDPEACNYVEGPGSIESCLYPGCIDVSACNYEINAGCSDGSCLYGGCTDPNACNFDENAACDGPCFYTSGCIDENACNYNPTALCDDGTCVQSGCTDPEACNYDVLAGCDDGSCISGAACYGCTVDGAENYSSDAVYDDGSCVFNAYVLIFHDANENGIYDVGETGLNNWGVEVVESGLTLYSNNNGWLLLSSLSEGNYTLNLIDNNDFWQSTNASSQILSVPFGDSVNFGLSSVDGTSFLSDVYSNPGVLICNDGADVGLWISNDGGTNLNGILTLSYNPLLEVLMDPNSVYPDVVESGLLTWNISELIPASISYLGVHFGGYLFDYMGEEFDFDFELSLVDGNDSEIYNNSWNYALEVACSYDPNDKQADPIGYAEPHFVLTGDRIEYTIRFQNTGNYPAEDIVVIDQLDLSVLDLTTFEPLYASADYFGCVHDDGLVEFMFNDIFLADSVSNEPESHGYVVFAIELKDNLVGGTIVNNNASIVFDSNEPIITNTTMHTVFDCNSFSGIVGDDSICFGEDTEYTGEQLFVETYQWYLNNEPFDISPSIILQDVPVGPGSLTLEISNPLCGSTKEFEFEVNALPVAQASADVAVCEGDDVTITASGGGEYEWSDNLGTENSITISPEETTTYTVTVFNEAGCSDSEDVNVVVNPLPGIQVLENGNILTAPDGSEWQWYLNGQLLEGSTGQELEVVVDGDYFVITWNEFGCTSTSETVAVLNLIGLDSENLVFYPNPVNEQGILYLPSGTWNLVLYNAIGQEMLKQFNLQTSSVINAAGFAAGAYTIALMNETGTKLSMKIVIN